MAASHKKQVLLMMNARKFLGVISRYAFEHGWRLTLMNDGLAPTGWKGDGAILSYSRSPAQKEFAARFAQGKIPAVALSYSQPQIKLPRVTAGFESIGRMGARHLFERGYETFVFCSSERLKSGEIVYRSYVDALNGLRFKGTVPSSEGTVPWIVRSDVLKAGHEFDWGRLSRYFARFIAKLKRPIGFFCQSDASAVNVLNACLENGLRVPEDAGILGVNDNPVLCENQETTISSINPDFDRIALTACEMLDRAMDGGELTDETIPIDPLGVSIRESTGLASVNDPRLAKATRILREHIADSYGIAELAAELGVSVSTLNRLFHELAGTTPAAELRRLKLEHAKTLLRGTDCTVEAIAADSGFANAAHLSNVFREVNGLTPGEWRAKWR